MTIPGLLRRFAPAMLAALSALSLLLAPNAAAQADNPPLWKVNGTLTLFGSFHMLPPGVDWRTPALARALEETLTIVLETDTASAGGENGTQPLLVKYGVLPPAQNLRGILPAKTRTELDRVVADLRMAPENLASMRPWLAGLVLSVQSMVNQGYDPAKGVESQVVAWGRQNGKAFDALESLESQMRLFGGLKREEEIALLSVSLRQIRESPRALAAMLAAYRKGDLAALEKRLHAGFEGQPALRNKVIGERHRQWLPRLEKMIATGRTHVVIVGAAHVVGPDGLVAMLRAKGYRLEGP